MAFKRYQDYSYWRQRYADGDPEERFEWYQGYRSGLKKLIRDRVPRDARILMIGCGNSPLSEEMMTDGYTDIVNIDFVAQVIRRMAKCCADVDGLTWEVMDARDLTFPDASFDVVIDKGTIDAMDAGPTNVAQICSEARRVLRPEGLFIVVSVAFGITRMSQLNRPELGWHAEKRYVRLGPPLFAYLMTFDDRE
ncbi:MAG: class I SAM-dependent methyltransferase [Myxococcota bacterium]